MVFFGIFGSFIHYRNVDLNQYSITFFILGYIIYAKIPFTEKEVTNQLAGFYITAAD